MGTRNTGVLSLSKQFSGISIFKSIYSKNVANKIKEEWVGNFFLGKRGKWMIVVEENSKVVGFLQLLEKNKKTIVIDLIAIEEKKRGKGLAKEMIAYAY